MKYRAVCTLGLSALVLTGALAGVAAQHGGVAFASERSESRAERHAASEAGRARKALAKGKIDQAVGHAEAAVGLRPQVAEFRMLLGASYLKAGRFDSARQTYADVLSLEPDNGKAALNLALAQVATGDWGGARQVLDSHRDIIPASDFGLAVALAGDPARAVDILGTAVRSPEADARTRQNLALALALAGRWKDAKTLVAVDLGPAEVDRRIMQWATFARPKAASDQVASLLGVTAAQDPGQPAALALNPGSTDLAAARSEPASDQEGTLATAEGAPAAPAEMAAAAEADPKVIFGPSREIVQPVKGRRGGSRAPAAVAVASTASGSLRPGEYFVQLGAFQNAAVAREAWNRITRRDAGFAARTPSGMSVNADGRSFYRLSVGGFARADAVALCSAHKARGGACFVRPNAGDQVASWVRPGSQLASR